MPHFIAGNKLNWTRYWAPLGSDYQGEGRDAGFLADPESDWGRIAKPKLKTTAQLTQSPFVVLSGKPGSGKTTEVDALEDHASDWLKPNEILIKFSCGSIDSCESLRHQSVNSPEWKQQISGGGNICLLIDGIDEGLKRLPVFVDFLTTLLKQSKDRVRVILTCRSAEWDSTVGSQLAALWDIPANQYIFELRPLRRVDVEIALKALKLNTESFFSSVYDNQIQSLAACPVTLKMLLNLTKKRGKLPASHHELYEKAILGLCEEIDESRARRLPQRPSTAHIHATAKRIAALLLLTGKSSVFKGNKIDAESTDLHWREIADASLAATHEAGDVEITESLISATLDTPLFGFRGYDRYGFDHQTFTEHLAAQFLRECSLRQLRNLLCVSLGDKEYAAPQLYETASRLALMHEEWCEYLTENQPEVLLRADATSLNEKIKSRALGAFLKKAENEEAFDDKDSMGFSHTLNHPGLAKQLFPYIENQNYNPVVRRIAFKIAGDSKVKELENVLWKQLHKDDSCTNYICHALREIGNKRSKQTLLKALQGKIKDDSVNDVKGLALRLLVPDILPVRSVLKFLTPQPDDHFYGSYEVALRHHLPKHITRSDLPAILRHLTHAKGCFDTLHYLHEFATKSFDLALEYLNDPGISKLCVALWLKKKSSHDILPHEDRNSEEEKKQGLGQTELRRKFVEQIFNTSGINSKDLRIWNGELVRKEDLDWLLASLPHIPKKTRKVWAEVCAQFIWWDEDEKYKGQFLKTYRDVKELRESLPIPKKYPIDITLRRFRKAGKLRRERMHKQHSKNLPKRSTRSEWITVLLKEASIKNYSAWVRFCEIAHLEDKSDPKNNYPGATHADITTAPGWRQLTSVQQDLFRTTARAFLLKYSDQKRKRSRWSNYADAGYHAIQLLEGNILKDLPLRRAITQKWTKCIFDHIGDSGGSHKRLMRLGYKLRPKIALSRFNDELMATGNDDYPMCLQRFEACWDSPFLRILARQFLKKKCTARLVRTTLYRLANINRSHAKELLLILLKQRNKYAPFDEYGRGLLAANLFMFPKTADWNPWKSFIALPKEQAQKLVLESVSLIDRSKIMRDEDFSNEQLATLAIKLINLFPPEEYHARNDPSGHVGSKHEIPEFRNRPINALVVRATEPSCNEIFRVSENVPEKDRIWIRWSHAEAKRGFLRKLWTGKPHAPDHVIAMSRDLRKLSVFTCDDLLEAVIDSLERLQTQVNVSESSEHMALWNEIKGEKSPKSEKALSDTIIAWLSKDIGKAKMILNREVEATKLGRLDIKVEAFEKGKKNRGSVTLVIEVKGSWNREIPKAVQTQLVERYLKQNRWTHGVFIVGWFGRAMLGSVPSFWPSANTVEAEQFLTQLVKEQHQAPHRVKGILLDCE